MAWFSIRLFIDVTMGIVYQGLDEKRIQKKTEMALLVAICVFASFPVGGSIALYVQLCHVNIQ